MRQTFRARSRRQAPGDLQKGAHQETEAFRRTQTSAGCESGSVIYDSLDVLGSVLECSVLYYQLSIILI